MQCQTVRAGQECFFWKKQGCTFEGGSCIEIVKECEGCKHIIEFESKKYCSKYPDPVSKWLTGPCNLASHLPVEEKEVVAKKINPLKASKRMSRGR